MMGNFRDELQTYADFDFAAFFAGVRDEDVLRVLQKKQLGRMDYLTLLAPKAADYLELMAQRAHRETVQNFGHTMQLFTPMYIANYCENRCVYCGFNHESPVARRQLTMAEIRTEGEAIAKTGLKQVLVLTGESQKYSSVDYILSAVEVLNEIFASVSLEVYAFSEADYRRAVAAGADGMTMFQEVYDQASYEPLHPAGPKSDYAYRLDAPERAARAGMRSIGLGALLGLHTWRSEAFFTGVHADYLQRKYKEIEIAISTPRLRPCTAGFQAQDLVQDKDLVQYITAYRLFMPRSGITLSTRESRTMRNHLIYLGITKISGGSTTAVGGHTQGEETGQFDISDTRTIEEMAAMLYQEGYHPVYKDWQVLV